MPYGELDALRFKAELEVAQASWKMSPRKLASPNWSRRTSANNCWQPSMVLSLDSPSIQFSF
jgi:hypothetical protein